ncbi:MAG: imidazolonepropionase [Actinomycetota bacterium]
MGALIAPRIVTPTGPPPRRRADLATPMEIVDGALAWDEAGTLIYVGSAADLSAPLGAAATRVGGVVIPGFVDAHTHLPFYGWRADEFEARVAGRSYRDLHGEGGGIARSARLLAAASDEEVIAFCGGLAAEMAVHGTTAFELKTGYGLSVEAELRQARLARSLARSIPQTTTVTLLACHAVPQGMDRRTWVDAVVDELIPRAADEGLADAVDVYVEDIAFDTDDLRRVADAASGRGLSVRCHADQLGSSGAAEAAVEAGARNADHLNHVSDAGIAALGASDTAAVLLPVADLLTRERVPPVSDLRTSGAAVALATDFNPGTAPCLSVPEVISTAASLYRLAVGEALTGTTLNAAWALGLHGPLGSLEVGKQADFLVLDTDDVSMLAYRPGHNPVAQTWIRGARAVSSA